MNPEPNQRDPRCDPKPGDVWRIYGTDGIIMRIEPGKVVANYARFRDGRWQEADVSDVGAAALWELAIPMDHFLKATAIGKLLQRAEDLPK